MTTLPSWNHDKKLMARHETIISPYQSIFGSKLPDDKQYWSMCGLCANAKNELLNGSELDQMIKENLITSNQFHGVEIEKERYDKNKLVPLNTNWYHGDLYNTIVATDNFNPGIVNVDSLLMPDKGAVYFSKIMYIVNSRKINNIMLIWNCILKTWYHQCTLENMINELYKNTHFQSAYPNGWNIKNSSYVYSGSGEHKRTILASVILFKKDLQLTPLTVS